MASYIGNQPRTTVDVDSYNGDGVTTNFTLREIPTTASAVWVFIDGVRQSTNAYTISSNTLSFSEAPQAGTNNIQVSFIGESTLIRGLEPNSVTTSAIADGSVTSAKIADGTVIATDILDGTVDNNKLVSANITGAKLVANTITAREIEDTAVTPGDYGGSAAIPVITVDAQGRLTYAANVALDTTQPANTITSSEIVNDSILANNISDGAITNSKIADGAVTSSKIDTTSTVVMNSVTMLSSTLFLGNIVEKANIVATGMDSTVTISSNDGGVTYFTGNSTANSTVNLVGLSDISVGNVATYVMLVTNASGSAKYVTAIQIDGQTQDSSNTRWLGGRPTYGLANTEIYTFSVIKTSATPTYNVFAQVSNFRY